MSQFSEKYLKSSHSELCLKMMEKDGMVLITLEIWAQQFKINEGDDRFEEFSKLFEVEPREYLSRMKNEQKMLEKEQKKLKTKK